MIVTGKVPVTKVIWETRRQFAIITACSLIAYAFHSYEGKSWINLPFGTMASLGVALGVFLNLRNNIVWDRYWEARSLWGRLINVSRTIPRQLDTFLRVPESQNVVEQAEREWIRQDVLRRHIAFVGAFRDIMRDDDPYPGVASMLSEEEARSIKGAVHIPSAVLHTMGEKIHKAWRDNLVSDFHLPQLDDSITELTDIIGGCEKIKNTPLPPAYTYLAHRVVLYYCCILPFGLVGDTDWLAIPLTLVCSFAFLTLDRISELIENPFSREDNDLPLDAMSRNIERELLQRIGETDLPPKEQPVNGVLL